MTRVQTVASGTRDPDVVLAYPSDRVVRRDFVIGPEYRLRSGTVLYTGTSIGDRLHTGHHVVIREQCVIGDDVAIWSNSVIDYGCRLGDGVKIHSNCYIAQHTIIGERAFLAPGVTVANDLYPGQQASREVMSGPWIGPGAQIGVNVTLLPFVRIGADALVGSGAVVTRDVPPGAVAYGNPAVVHGQVADLPEATARVEPESTTGVDVRYQFVSRPCQVDE